MKLLKVHVENDVVVDYNNVTEHGAIPVRARLFTVDENDERGEGSVTAQVWTVPFEPQDVNALLSAADEAGGNFFEVAVAALENEDALERLIGVTTVVVESVLVSGKFDESVSADLQIRALAYALHAAGARHGVAVLANSASATSDTLEALCFERSGKLRYADTALLSVEDAIAQGCGLPV